MANEFKIKKGLIVTGASGGTVVDIQGSQGQLFSVTDDLSGSIFAVSDISGVPIFDVNSSGQSTFVGDVTAPTFLGDLNGTINTATTGVTQTAGNNSTLIATTAYADAAAAAVPIGNYLPLTAGSGSPLTGDLYAGTSTAGTDRFIRTYYNDSTYTEMRGYGIITNRAGSYYRPANDKTQVLSIGNDGNTWNYISQNANYHTFGKDTSEWMRIDTSGNIGIGTTSPAAALDVVGSGLATLFRVSNTTADATIKYGAITGRHYTNSEENVTGMLITSSSSVTGGTVSIGGGISAANAVNNIILYTAANNTTLIGSERMRIDSSGNIGIGTTSPSSFYPGDNNLVVGSGTGDKAITVYAGDTSTAYYLFAKGTIGADRYHGQVRYNFNADTMEFTAGGSTSSKFTIKSTGVLQVPSLGQGFLQTDSSGNISISGGGTLPGGPYLPLAGGTMTGDLLMDGKAGVGNVIGLATGTSSNAMSLKLYTYNNINPGGGLGTSTGNMIQADLGSNLVLRQTASDGDITFQSDDGSGGIATYLTLDGSSTDAYFSNPGNVGIGTTSPLGQLDVRQAQQSSPFTTPFLKLYPSTTTNLTGHTTITLGTSPVDNYGVSLSGWRYGADGDPKFRIKMHNNSASGIDALTIDSSGDVGIGTTSPNYKLEVDGTLGVSRTDGIIFAGSSGLGTGSKIVSNTSNDLIFNTALTSLPYTTTERVRILNNGNVGIGATSPADKLEVKDGSIRLNSTSSYPSTNVIKATWNGSTSPPMGSIGWEQNPGFIGSEWSHYKQTSPYTQARIRLIGDASSGGMFVNLNGSDVFTIKTSSGNVGIGTTSPVGKLDVKQAATNGNNSPFANPHVKLTATATADNQGFVGITTATSTADNYGYSFGAQRTSGGVGNFKINYHNNSSQGVNRFLIDQNGNVGIGTTSPNHELVVQGTSSPNIELKNSNYSNGGFILNRTNYGHQWKWWSESNVMYFGFSTDESTYSTKLAIESSGDVGIGTTNPETNLHIKGSSNSSFTGTGEHLVRIESDTTNNQYTGIGFSQASGIDIAKIAMKRTSSGSNLFFGTSNNYGNGVTNAALVIDHSGNVGMGITTPSSNMSSSKVLELSSTGNAEIVLDHIDGGTASDIGLLSFERSGDHLAHIKATHDGATDSAFISFHTQATGGSFSNAASNEKMRIKSNGNVGIGTSTPLYLLDAAGTIRCTSLIQTSQSDKKENIGNIDKSKPKAIPFKEYRYKSDIDSTGRKRYGVLAEDIENDYPELVYVDSNGDKAVNYIDLLVKRVAELEKELEDISLTPGPKGDKGDTGSQGPAGANGTNGKDGVNGNDHLKNVQSITFNERTGQLEITIEGYKDPFKFNPDK